MSESQTQAEKRRAAHREWLKRNAEHVREYHRQYNRKRLSTEEGRARKLQQDRESRARNKGYFKLYDKNRDPLKVKAGRHIRNAVYAGTLKRQPCEKCGLPNAQAHHEDYTKPSEVIWLCARHHKELHLKTSCQNH